MSNGIPKQPIFLASIDILLGKPQCRLYRVFGLDIVPSLVGDLDNTWIEFFPPPLPPPTQSPSSHQGEHGGQRPDFEAVLLLQ